MQFARLVAALLALSSPALALAAETTQVYADNGQLEYVGPLDDAANGQLFALYEKLPNKPTVLAIRSVGGEVNTGIALGRWVRAHKLDVRVLEFCLSSCANYVFTAGLHKTVSNFAVIGYHGGPGKFHLDPATQQMVDALGPSERQAMMDGFNQVIARDRQAELAYFKEIGVRADFSSLGQEERYASYVNTGAAGWTYSLDGFADLGVQNIKVINGPWKPGSALDQAVFVTLPVKAPLVPAANAVKDGPVRRQMRHSGITSAPSEV